MKFYSLLLFVVLFTPSWGQYQIQEERKLEGASVAYVVKDLQSGIEILSHNEYTTLAPASVMKLFSTAVALDKMGSDYRFTSKFYIVGTIANNVLNGSVIVDPNYNPSLASSRLGFGITALAGELKKVLTSLNINTIKGNVTVLEPVSSTEGIPRTWIWEDMGNYFGSAFPSCIYDENILKVYLKSDGVGELTKVLKTEPFLPWLTIESKVKGSTIRTDLAYCFSRPGDDKITITGTIPANRKSFLVKASLPQPALSFAYALSQELKSQGVSVKRGYSVVDELDKNAKLIHVHQGATLGEVVQKTNTHSINVWAETLLNAAHQSDSSSSMNRTKWLKNELSKHFNGEAMRIFDGSGLSRFNAVSGSHIVGLLSWMHHHPEKAAFEKSFAVAGKSGTFSSLLKGTVAAGYVKGKSGYMNGVKCYAGIITAKSGKELAFSIQVNNYNISNGRLKKHIEKWLLTIWLEN